jgi:hypothetical protein
MNNNVLQKIVLIVIVFFFGLTTQAQDYTEAFGARMGVRSGVMYKNFFDDQNSMHAMLNFQRGGIQFTFVRQFYQPVLLNFTQKLFFYYGCGGHLGYSTLSNDQYLVNGETYRREEFSVIAGITANLGLEYHVIKYPIIIALDYHPFYEINIPLYFRKNYYDFGLTLMYCF